MSRSRLIALMVISLVAGPASANTTMEPAAPTLQPDGTLQRPVSEPDTPPPWVSTFSIRHSTASAATRKLGRGPSIPAIADVRRQARRGPRSALRLWVARSCGISPAGTGRLI